MHHLGVDISKAKFDVSLLVENKYTPRVFNNDLQGFRNLVSWLQPLDKDSVHICMEGTGRLWEPLSEFLNDRGFYVSVVNPARIKGFADSELRRSKSDSIDAKIIARFSRSQSPKPWVAPSVEVKAVRDRQRHLDALKVDLVRQENRLCSGVLDEEVQRSIQKQIEFLRDEIRTFEARLKELISTSSEIKESYQLLTSIIGVGPSTAITFLGEIGSLSRFETSRELEVFCGIAPRIFRSGSSVRGKTRMSKKGNSRIRKALYMAALSASRHNPPLRTFAEKLKAAGKPGKVVICAVMRKLLRIMFAVLKSRLPFDSEFRSKRPVAA